MLSADGTHGQQIDWFQRQFLKLAEKASSTNDRREALKLKHHSKFLASPGNHSWRITVDR
jgi:hypothetical protein